MEQTVITYKCGHKARIAIGPETDVAWLSGQPCMDCLVAADKNKALQDGRLLSEEALQVKQKMLHILGRRIAKKAARRVPPQAEILVRDEIAMQCMNWWFVKHREDYARYLSWRIGHIRWLLNKGGFVKPSIFGPSKTEYIDLLCGQQRPKLLGGYLLRVVYPANDRLSALLKQHGFAFNKFYGCYTLQEDKGKEAALERLTDIAKTLLRSGYTIRLAQPEAIEQIALFCMEDQA